MEKNITQKAIALKYDIEKDNAPKITAKGKGETASNIIKIAKEHDYCYYTTFKSIFFIYQIKHLL
jgi:type III secretion system FlhB-like substrate exporter